MSTCYGCWYNVRWDRIAHFKCPDAIKFGSLPKTSTGKVQKYVLRDHEWTGREKRIN